MKYEKTIGGYFYKVYNNGDRKRISKEVFDKSIKKGGMSSIRSINLPATKYYQGIDNENENEQSINKQAINKQAHKQAINKQAHEQAINEQAINEQAINEQAINKQAINEQALLSAVKLRDDIIKLREKEGDTVPLPKNFNTMDIIMLLQLQTKLSYIYIIKKIYKESGMTIKNNNVSKLYNKTYYELFNIIEKLSKKNEEYNWNP
jgi:hypothetical protein